MLRLLTAAALSIALVGSAASATIATSEPLTLGDALAAALLKNPSLQAFGYESRIAEARILQAGIRPNPELSVDVENILGTGALSGVKGLETTLQLSQVIDLAGSRARLVETAEREHSLADADYEAKRIDVLAEVARRFIEVVADAQRLETAHRATELGEQTVAAVRRRVEAAAASPMELQRARMALARLQIDQEHAEHELAAHRQSLAAILGDTEPTFGPAQADLHQLPEIPDFESLAARLEMSPVLARFAVEARWREAQIRLAQSLRRSGMRVSGGVRRVESSDDFGFVAGISLPLPMRDQQAGSAREARVRRDQIEASAEAMRLEMRATLFEVYQEMLHAQTALSQLQNEVVPLADESLAMAEQGYRTGRFSLLELLDAQKSQIDVRAQLVANATAFHLHVIEIERLLGAPLLTKTPRS